jgi:hypothetical protein
MSAEMAVTGFRVTRLAYALRAQPPGRVVRVKPHGSPWLSLWRRNNLRVEEGHSYRYRHVLNGKRWENTQHADGYVPNPYGSDDSVIVVEGPACTKHRGAMALTVSADPVLIALAVACARPGRGRV